MRKKSEGHTATMVRRSSKQLVLDRLDEVISTTLKRLVAATLMGLSVSDLEVQLYLLRGLRSRVRNSRYLQRGKYRKRHPKFDLYLRTDHDNRLTDREFKFHFRVTRDCFWQLVSLLEEHPSFKRKGSDTRGKPQKPAAHQLLILLKYFGSDGNAGSSVSLGTFFGIGSGTVDDCKERALEGLLSLEDRTYIWPNGDERRAIANRIKENHLFPNCVGIIDGTLLPLATRPLLHGENYLSRKKFYAIVMLIVCDDQCRITYYHVGWPGSVHDNRVWRTCNLFKNCDKFFSSKEYLLGDSAFTASNIMVPPYKSYAGSFLSGNQSAFNTLLSKPRVKSEHCIGRLKGRLPFLKGIRNVIGNKKHMDRVIDLVRGSVILHNFLIKEPIDEDWINNSTDGNDDLDPEGTSSNSNQPDYRRRDDLLYYLSELQETSIN